MTDIKHFDLEIDRLSTALHRLLSVVRVNVVVVVVVVDILPVQFPDAARYGGPGSGPHSVPGEAD